MINSVDIRINAENPNFPMRIFRAFVNSPTSVRVRNVPSKIGAWQIDKVFVSVSYPDNEIHSKEFVKVDDLWVATIPASTVPGKSSNGYIISADGVDEKGNPVQGYIMGKGDVEILDTDGTITPGETTYYIHLLPSRPETPHKGDAYVDGGVWWFYNGEAWVTLGGTFAGNGWAQYPQSQGGDGKWHRVIIANGALAYDEQGFDEPPDAAPFALKSELTAEKERATAAENAKVPTDGDHTINGVKTFAQSPLVPTVQTTDDDSHKVASTRWVTAKISAWWNSIKSTVTFAKSQVGLDNVDNTSDANKPISKATQTALNAKANDNAVVKLTGDQTIDGVKTFSGTINSTGGSVKGSAFAAAGMPSNSRVDLILPESGTSFRPSTQGADFSGWLVFVKRATAVGQSIVIENARVRFRAYAVVASQYLTLNVPVSKGDYFSISYTAEGSTSFFYMSKANAEVA